MKKTDLAKLVDYSKLKFKVTKSMRYDDVGDYFDNTIVAYDLKNPVYNNGIMLHEFIEYTLIKSAGIPVGMIDAFDTDETAEEKYPREYALYTKYHQLANKVEKEFIENMGLSWKDYQKAVYAVKVNVKKGKNGFKKVRKNWKVR